MERVIIFDTTLRDGEQAAGASMTIEEKVMLARHLEVLGVDVIEAGFANSSNAEFEAISKISETCYNAIICSLSRARNDDILASFNALKNAHKKRIHTFISTSDIHIKYKLNKTYDQVIEMIRSSVGYARTLVEDVEWSAEDATRTNFDFLSECIEAAVQNGATTINIPDTVGYSTPDEYGALIGKLKQQFDSVIFSAHCHNDLGLAVANSLAAIDCGVRQIECTVNGIGERAGNAALEEVVMAIKTRSDKMPYITNIDSKQIYKTSSLISNITGFHIQKNKAIVGSNAFSHASGIHQDGMIKNNQTYEIMNPADVGRSNSNLILGKLSGKAALSEKCKELGIVLSSEALEGIFVKFKKLCDSKKIIYDQDILSLVSVQSDCDKNNYILDYMVNNTSNGVEVEITLKLGDNMIKKKNTDSLSVLDAGFKCINDALQVFPKLQEYELKAVTSDSDSQGVVNVSLSCNDRIFSGRSCNIDVIFGSLNAYLDACLKI